MRIAINGFGRIGRAAFKIILKTPALELVAVNDLAPLAYLLKYDTVYGWYERRVDRDDEHLIVDGELYRVFTQKDPARLPWAELGVDLVLECTGAFRRKEDLEQHIRAGARYVILARGRGRRDAGRRPWRERPRRVDQIAPNTASRGYRRGENGPFRSDGPAPRYGAQHATVSFRRLGAATPLAYNFARSEESPHVGPNGELRNHGKRTLGR